MRDAIISIKSIQTSGEETDTTEIITEGQYVIVSKIEVKSCVLE